MAREYQDDLVAVNSARLRAEGVIKPDAISALVSFGEGESASARGQALAPQAGARPWLVAISVSGVRGEGAALKLHDGRPQCRNCLKRQGVQFRIACGTRAERAEARAKRIEKLRAKLAGGPLRLDGRGMARRRELELSLRRVQIREREGFLEVADEDHGGSGFMPRA